MVNLVQITINAYTPHLAKSPGKFGRESLFAQKNTCRQPEGSINAGDHSNNTL